MSAGRAPVEAVIFDWGGTLTPWHTIDLTEQWLVYAKRFAAAAGQDMVDVEALAARILEVEDRAWKRLRVDGSSAHIAEVLRDAGVESDHPGHSAALTAYQEFWEPHTFTDPQVEPLWRGLRERGVKVGVLSNTIWPADYHDGVFARDGVLELLDGAVYTSEIDHAKPHREAFRAALAAVGVQDASAAVYVGDRPYEDVHGAQRAGLRAIWVPHSDIPMDQQVSVDVTPDGVAHELLDILEIVDGWLSA